MGRGSSVGGSIAALVAGSLWIAFPAAAQQYPMPSEQKDSPTCLVFAGASADGVQEIRARCWGTARGLGYADSFQAFDNSALRATVVVTERDGERRVLLLRPYVDGQPIVEDISGTLALASGRMSWAGIEGLALDFGQFDDGGRIGIAHEPTTAISEGESRGSTDEGTSPDVIEVRIDQYIELDEARLAASPVAQAR